MVHVNRVGPSPLQGGAGVEGTVYRWGGGGGVGFASQSDFGREWNKKERISKEKRKKRGREAGRNNE